MYKKNCLIKYLNKMKKFLILITLLSYSIMFSQEVEVDSLTTGQNVERLVDKYSNKIIEGFNSVVEKSTPIAKQGFYVAVKLNIAQGVAELLPLFFFCIFVYVFIKEYNKIRNILSSDNIPIYMNRNYVPMDDTNSTPLLWASLILTCILFILAIFTTISGIKHLIAPEWYAVKDIIELFK